MTALQTERTTGVLPAVEALRETIAGHVPWQEENRRLHPDVVDALSRTGVFGLRTPKAHGGAEASTRELLEVAATIGEVDGATAWTAAVYWIPTWMASQLPEEGQAEVFAEPDTRVCGTLSPGGVAVPTDGGYVVSGQWGFISGALHADWQLLVAVDQTHEQGPLPVVALVRMEELQVVDDWHTSGLRATGSVTTAADGVFVPAGRVAPLPVVLEGRGPRQDSDIFAAPLLPVASACSVGSALGMARGALAAFEARIHGRGITYTGWSDQAQAPLTHRQLACARLLLDEATFHAERLVDLVDSKAAAHEEWTVQERVHARGLMGAVVSRAKEVADLTANASGGSSIYTTNAAQRFWRDLNAVNLHALMHPDTNFELYGRTLAGLEPDTLYV